MNLLRQVTKFHYLYIFINIKKCLNQNFSYFNSSSCLDMLCIIPGAHFGSIPSTNQRYDIYLNAENPIITFTPKDVILNYKRANRKNYVYSSA